MQPEAAGLFSAGLRDPAATPETLRRPPADYRDYSESRRTFFDRFAPVADAWGRKNPEYHRAVRSLAGYYIPPGARVLEIGCGTGDLLAALSPSDGLGIDLSAEMVRLATKKHPDLRFRQMAAEELDLAGERFDYIVLSDLIGYLYDIREVFRRLRGACHARTRVVISWYNRLWQPVISLAERLGVKPPLPLLNWTTPEDVENLLYLAGFERIHRRGHILLPKRVPALTPLANRYLAHLPGFRWLCLTNWIVARPVGVKPEPAPLRVSVISPCRNEAGNIEPLVRRLPRMGSHTELIFVEGHSRDGTLEECRRVAAAYPDRDIKVFVQEGIGKADAVRLGFARASGDALIILDADLSVAPEDLPQFYELLAPGQGEFVNGSRLVYAMDSRAMRFLNLLGNRAFALLLSSILGQPIKDTLCGTKALLRQDYARIATGRHYFGDFDPFGDYELIFGAAKLNLRIVEVPVRYHTRVYGQTNISRFTHGWLLLRMSVKAAANLLFVS
ncbi:MAG: glycosyltransferase [Candidatus Rokubacteria bacterium]|nr:glycosyltransferase [Candidatus Rokubacteria bacterium]